MGFDGTLTRRLTWGGLPVVQLVGFALIAIGAYPFLRPFVAAIATPPAVVDSFVASCDVRWRSSPGRIDTGTSRSQKERREKLIETIEERAGQEDNGAVPVETLTEIADDQLGATVSQVEHDIEQLERDGRIIEPAAGEVRAT